MISDQIVLHSVQLPLSLMAHFYLYSTVCMYKNANKFVEEIPPRKPLGKHIIQRLYASSNNSNSVYWIALVKLKA